MILNIKEFFNGKLQGHGIIKALTGQAINSFVMDMDCQWQGNQAQWYENFTFSNNSSIERVWDISINDQGRIIGEAMDVIGKAIGYENFYGALFYYQMNIPISSYLVSFSMKDKMYFVSNSKIISIIKVSKFFVPLAEIILAIEKC